MLSSFNRILRSSSGAALPGGLAELRLADGTAARVFADAAGTQPAATNLLTANAAGMVWGHVAPGLYNLRVMPPAAPVIDVELDLRVRVATRTSGVTIAGAGSSVWSRCFADYSVQSTQRTAGKLRLTLSRDCPWASGTPVWMMLPDTKAHTVLTRVTARTFDVPSPGPDTGVVSTPGGSVHSLVHAGDGSWMQRVNAHFGGALRVMGWPSKGGDWPADSEQRLPYLLSLGADILVLDTGLGNWVLTTQEVDAAWPNVVSQILRAQATGALVVVPNLKPRAGDAGMVQARNWLQANEQLDTFCRRLTNVRVADVGAAMQDLSSAAGAARPGLHCDGIHLNAAGAIDFAQPIIDAIAPFVQPLKLGRRSAVDTFARSGGRQVFDGLRNPVGVTLTGTGVSGTWDDNVRVAGTGTGRTIVGSLVAGQNGLVTQRVVYAGQANTNWMVAFRGTNAAPLVGRMAPGKRYRASVRGAISAVTGTVAVVEVQVVGTVTGGTELTLAAARTHQGDTSYNDGQADPASHAQTAAEDTGWVFEPFVVPTDVTLTDIDLRFAVIFASGGTSMTLDVHDITIQEVLEGAA